MEENKFHEFIRMTLKVLEGEPDPLKRAALQAQYEMTRLTLYILKGDQVGYSEKTIFTANAFAKLLALVEADLGAEPGTVAQRVGWDRSRS